MVSKGNEFLAAEHIRASHMVSQCHETLGAERIRALHEVSMCCETLGAEHTRASHGKPRKSHIDMVIGTPKADSTTRTLMKTP